ncbi:hypothetical protein [Brevibacterium ihuae]|uniref:hypothetical protein n=1 Tax=Brevibacterium ihuae TaxID=1631743 RepID=UPI000C77A8C7|nr:hypothetical protein [Brevibacterium ihuae]
MPESSPLRPARRPHSAAPAAIAVAVLVLTGCTAPEEEHPLASPTSDTAAPAAEPTPAYTTELQLSEEEKTAVDEALTGLDEYISVLNEVYRAGGEGVEKFDEVARDSVLFAAKDEVDQMQSQGVQMIGEYRLDSKVIETVDLRIDDETQIPFVTVHSCIPRHEFSFSEPAATTQPSREESFGTYRFVIAEYDDAWFVSEQELWVSECD